jgi:plasmid replication initiation protein
MKSEKKQLQALPYEYHEANVIIWGKYMLSATSQQLISMAMKTARMVEFKEGGAEYKTIEGQFSISQFCQALGIAASGEKRRIARKAIDGLGQSIITYDDEEHKTHTVFPWVIRAVMDAGSDKIIIRFNPELTPYILDLNKNYTRLSLEYMGKLHSKYSIRLYKLAMSRSGFAGRNGNKPDEWVVSKMSFNDIKTLFKISSNEYKNRNDNFKRKVIDEPVAEINNAAIGIHIEAIYTREGRRYVAVTFQCNFEQVKSITQKSHYEGAETQASLQSAEDYAAFKPQFKVSDNASQNEMAIITAFPEEAAEIGAALDAIPSIWKDPVLQKTVRDGNIIRELRARHPDFKQG